MAAVATGREDGANLLLKQLVAGGLRAQPPCCQGEQNHEAERHSGFHARHLHLPRPRQSLHLFRARPLIQQVVSGSSTDATDISQETKARQRQVRATRHASNLSGRPCARSPLLLSAGSFIITAGDLVAGSRLKSNFQRSSDDDRLDQEDYSLTRL